LEAAVEKLKLPELLRYAFSGALFYLSLGLVYLPKGELSLTDRSAGYATLAIGLVLLSGSLLYVVHRALTYPFIFLPGALLVLSLFGRYQREWKIVIPFLESNAELEVDRCRLHLRFELGPKGRALHTMLDEWSAQVHLLYCSSMAVGLALCARVYWCPHNFVAWKILLVIAVVFLIAAMSHHLRLLIRILTLQSERK
jgi:hypothetical protein